MNKTNELNSHNQGETEWGVMCFDCSNCKFGIRHPVRTHHRLKEKYYDHSQNKHIMKFRKDCAETPLCLYCDLSNCTNGLSKDFRSSSYENDLLNSFTSLIQSLLIEKDLAKTAQKISCNWRISLGLLRARLRQLQWHCFDNKQTKKEK